MADKFEVKHVGRWAVAQTKAGDTLLRFSWTTEPDQNFLIPAAEAEKIAQTILHQIHQTQATKRRSH